MLNSQMCLLTHLKKILTFEKYQSNIVSKYMLKMTINYFFVILFLACPIFAKNMGTFNISGYGPIYVVTDEKYVKNVEMHENGFTLRGGGRIYFSKEPRDDFHPDMYWAVSYSYYVRIILMF